ncbi:hypothetical protein P7K49_024535 [Saguinus oedipus]|uniref:Mini-chromosome maintenance complex-binding protein n=1 Tax=Saguinus oedipus TaxID=9490 RepID=A0ABQ9UQK8_SAGOE|nr:hypothetical protein P7K49_024535 [Saguinus oedipus]
MLASEIIRLPDEVPSLNEVPLHYLKPNSFVKFRCMIQDMFDPEFYMGVYETVNQNTKAHAQARVSPSTSYTPSRHKRSYEDDDDMDLQPNKQKDQHAGGRQAALHLGVGDDVATFKSVKSYSVEILQYSLVRLCFTAEQLGITSGQDKEAKQISLVMYYLQDWIEKADLTVSGSVGGLQWCGEPKRLETEASAGQQMNSLNFSSPFDLNFPLPGEKGPACLVKVYEDWDCFKVNDILELYGILSVDPVLSILNNDERVQKIAHFLRDASALLDPMECTDTVEEQRVHSPPASLVPRIHVILAQKLQHINPYTRRDVLPLGKFTVNLSGCPRNSTFTEHLYRIIQHLVPASFRLQMTIENMNHLKFIPHKDYTANRLVSGLLQLPSNTSLVIDETLLEQGQLDTSGVHNVTALSTLITWQKVDYDFSYHRMEFPCNINVFITSEGRSLLPADCQIHLQPQLIPPNMEEYMNSLLSAVLPSVLNKFRIYLTLLRFLDYSISDEITKAVEDDFVEMRKNDPQSITADDLHQLLVVAR